MSANCYLLSWLIIKHRFLTVFENASKCIVHPPEKIVKTINATCDDNDKNKGKNLIER